MKLLNIETLERLIVEYFCVTILNIFKDTSIKSWAIIRYAKKVACCFGNQNQTIG